MFGLEGLSFGAPLVLAALLALPAIYWLLRVTPPAPRRVRFPAIQFLLGLRASEETPARTPPWLLALRLIAAGIVILALAEPTFDANPAARGSGPLVLFVDNGWPAAAEWRARQAAMRDALSAAARDGRSVVLIATAEAEATPPEPLDAAKAMKAAEELSPEPWLPDRKKALAALATLELDGAPDVFWLSDGLDHGGAGDIADALAHIGRLTVLADAPAKAPLALVPPVNGPTGFEARVLRADAAEAREGRVVALSARGEILGEASFGLEAGATDAATELALPLELRNETARLAIAGADAAGAVQLLDSRFRRRPVGVVSGGSTESAQPLLSDVYYIERALSPYAEIRKGTIGEVLDKGVAVLALADIGQITGEERDRVAKFVENGGVLLRFAGPRLATHSDDLVPVTLRTGERHLGSALAWPEPQTLAAFPDEGPFRGLDIPGDVTVTRQVLAEPSVEFAQKSWARLADGTPLVTGTQRGAGWIVLFHVTASPGWSSLPISGLYVEMLRRVLALAEGLRPGQAAEERAGVFPPLETLDGFGRLGKPPPQVAPISGAEIEKTVAGPSHPPGIYGGELGFVALNAVDAKAAFKPLPALSAAVAYYTGRAASELKFPLLAAALLLLLADAIVSLWLRGHLRLPGGAAGLFTRALPFAAFLFLSVLDARADDSKILAAALDTRLAYVATGDSEVDTMSRAGLFGLGLALAERTAYEPAEPMAVDVEKDDLSFYPLLYWPMETGQKDLSPQAVAKVDTFLKTGGTILFDTRDQQLADAAGFVPEGQATLRRLIAKLDLPPLEPVPEDHVLTKAFYLLHDFPGRWTGGQVWVEALPPASTDGSAAPARGGDGVSPVIIGGNDWAAAWARDRTGRPLAAVVPGGERQREIAIRFGVNVVMYAMTGNYKTDQVHVPALLERLGQ